MLEHVETFENAEGIMRVFIYLHPDGMGSFREEMFFEAINRARVNPTPTGCLPAFTPGLYSSPAQAKADALSSIS
jgi:hypothetical protein